MLTTYTLIKIAFFVVATFTATALALLASGGMLLIGYLTQMPPSAAAIAVATVGFAAFSLTIAVFALAATLFLNKHKPAKN